MHAAAILLALGAAFCIGLGLVLSQIGLRGISPVAGAAISIPSSALLFIGVSPFALMLGPAPQGDFWAALPIFAAVGLLYPATVTLLTFAANRRIGAVITGTLGNFTPVFAVAIAVVVLHEPLRLAHVGGLAVIIAGVMLLTVPRKARPADWRSWLLLLPLAGAVIRGIIQPAVKVGLGLWPSPFTAALIGYLVSSLIVLAAARLRHGRYIADAPLRARLWFVAVGLVNGLGLLLMYSALANGPVAVVAPLVATYPLATVGVGALVLGWSEGGRRLALGVVMTVVGVGLLLTG